MFDDQLAVIETPETNVQVDLNDKAYANESAILVEVKSKSDKKKSEQYLIKRMNPAQSEKVKTELTTEFGASTEDTALNEYLLAAFYEQKKLFIDAITSYEKAIKMAPDVPSYKEAYEEFLLRNKIKVVIP